jgi:hypothetical protein
MWRSMATDDGVYLYRFDTISLAPAAALTMYYETLCRYMLGPRVRAENSQRRA